MSQQQSKSVIFIGESSLCLNCIKFAKQNGLDVVLVLTSDEQILELCTNSGINVAHPKSIRNLGIRCDYLFSIVNDIIISKDYIKNFVNKLAVNYHDSQLPRYAGIDSTIWEIINEEKITGVSWHLIEAGIDTGDIVKSAEIAIDNSDSAFTLNLKKAELGYKLFKQLVLDLHNNCVTRTPQAKHNASYYGRKHMLNNGGLINWVTSIHELSKLKRALDIGSRKIDHIGKLKVSINNTIYLISEFYLTQSINSIPGSLQFQDKKLTIGITNGQLHIISLLDCFGNNVDFEDIYVDTDYIDNITFTLDEIHMLELAKINEFVKFYNAQQQNDHKNTISVLDQKSTTDIILLKVTNVNRALCSLLIVLAKFISDQKFEFDFVNLNHSFSSRLAQLLSYQQHSFFNLSKFITTQDVFKFIDKLTKPSPTFKDFTVRYLQQMQRSQIGIIFSHDTNINIEPPFERDINIIFGNAEVRLVSKKFTIQEEYMNSLIMSCCHIHEQLMKNENIFINKLSLLDDCTLRFIKSLNSNTTKALPRSKLIHKIFENQVRLTPNNIALAYNDQTLTYKELNTRANHIASLIYDRYLEFIGTHISTDMLIGMCFDRGIDMVVGILAILKSGGAYVPIDPYFPAERINYILSDAKLELILTQTLFVNKFDNLSNNYTLLNVDECEIQDEELATSNEKCGASGMKSNQLAYIIYTSGTTGSPKGVMIEHQSVVNHILNQISAINFNAKDAILQFSKYTFDASVEQFFMPLFTGGKIVLVDNDVLLDYSKLDNYINCHGVTVIDAVPSFLDEISGLHSRKVRCVISGGESCTKSLIQRWVKKGCIFLNDYGPTECTVSSIQMLYTSSNIDDIDKVLLGNPITNTQCYILNSSLEYLPRGIVGELYIGGIGLARGYLNNEQLTAEKFINLTMQDGKVHRLYKTGDLCRYSESGAIEYVGRNDSQIKIRGFRVELGEIESALLRFPSIKQAIVLIRNDLQKTTNSQYLVGYYTLHEGYEDIMGDAIQDMLSSVLPEYMVPQIFMKVDDFPLNYNGKVDRNALAKIPMLVSTGQKEINSPANHIEEALIQIWGNVLNKPEDAISVTDSFFKLGGNSILCIRLLKTINDHLKLNMNISTVFNYTNIRDYASYLLNQPNISLQIEGAI